MDSLLSCLRAAAEPTRLRLLAMCAECDMTVTDLIHILGQSQPRVSRHLKLLCDAGLLDRFREGSWVFYRLAETTTEAGRVARRLVSLLPEGDFQAVRDRERLAEIKASRAEAAESYFRANAARWDSIRSLHVDESEVERAMLTAFPDHVEDMLDIGTGTGRMLRLFARRIDRGVGIDQSRDMLAFARANLEGAEFRHCHVRLGDMYRLPAADATYDAVVIHQVLHYAERPGAALAEAGRVLKPGGLLLIVDFAPHKLESLRTEHAHRRLGFADREMFDWCRDAGLQAGEVQRFPGSALTVTIWQATRPPYTATTVVERDEAATAEVMG